jgi:hypothetical protein
VTGARAIVWVRGAVADISASWCFSSRVASCAWLWPHDRGSPQVCPRGQPPASVHLPNCVRISEWLEHADRLEQQLEQHGPDEPTVRLRLTDDVFLRSDTWARRQLGIALSAKG